MQGKARGAWFGHSKRATSNAALHNLRPGPPGCQLKTRHAALQALERKHTFPSACALPGALLAGNAAVEITDDTP